MPLWADRKTERCGVDQSKDMHLHCRHPLVIVFPLFMATRLNASFHFKSATFSVRLHRERFEQIGMGVLTNQIISSSMASMNVLNTDELFISRLSTDNRPFQTPTKYDQPVNFPPFQSNFSPNLFLQNNYQKLFLHKNINSLSTRTSLINPTAIHSSLHLIPISCV